MIRVFSLSLCAVFFCLMLSACTNDSAKKQANSTENPVAENPEATNKEAVAESPNRPLFIGVWQLESVQDQDLSEAEKKMTFEFKADGTCKRVRGDKKVEGKWAYIENQGFKTLVITLSDKVEQLIVHELTASKLIIFDKSKAIVFVKK